MLDRRKNLRALCCALAFLSPSGVLAEPVPLDECKALLREFQDGNTGSGAILACIDILLNEMAALQDADAPRRLKFARPQDLASGWTRYPAGYEPFGYALSEDGMVYLDGMMSGCPAADRPIFVLPPGMRPAGRLIFAQMGAGNKVVRVDVETDGRVIYHAHPDAQHARACATTAPGGRWLSLSGIQFPAAP